MFPGKIGLPLRKTVQSFLYFASLSFVEKKDFSDKMVDSQQVSKYFVHGYFPREGVILDAFPRKITSDSLALSQQLWLRVKATRRKESSVWNYQMYPRNLHTHFFSL